jgi:hypothetical protein
MAELILRVSCLCLFLAGAETIHGIVRMRFLVPRVGKPRAQRISIVTGSLLAFGICYLVVPTMGLHSQLSLLILGMVLSGFMAAFDIVIGRFAVRMPWPAVLADFNPAKGNLILIGLLLLFLFPLLIVTIKA